MNILTDESSIQSLGGKARAKKLSTQQRSKIARYAAEMRWLPKASYQGEVKIGDISLKCYVLEDGRRVLNQRTMADAFNIKSKGGNVFMRSMRSKSIGSELPQNIKEKLENPIIIKTLRGDLPKVQEADILVNICTAIVDAKRKNTLSANQQHLAQQAEILLSALGKVAIVALIDEATGYQAVRPADALQAYLEKIISKELAAWVKKFPDEFYENIYKLRGWTWPGMAKNRYSVVGKYTRDLVFERIAPGLLPELVRKSPKDEKGNRRNKLHQWLTEDIGDPMLAQHLHSLIMFQRLAIVNNHSWNRFIKMVDQVLPKKGATLELPLELEMD